MYVNMCSVDAQNRDQQAGFRKDRSCTDRIATLRIIVEQSIEWNSKLYINFIDYEKAFGSLDKRTLWKLLRHYGVFEKIVNIIRDSYYGLHCKYNTVSEKVVNIIRNSYDGLQCKVVHGGRLTDTFQGKTKVLKYNTEKSNPTTLDGKALEDVESFTYLGSIIDVQGGSDTNVKATTGKARAAFLQLKNIWNSKQLTTNIKVRIFNTNVKIVLLYGAET
ncbi:unnamed protein product [Schistosoma margrebowiei]|uniref:Uncharacterized protein n=1 Tax=Schistosoma margrebowiei TaxID=48269 RepID=A0A183N9N6_9TREM|nr:unnamed protein product [Schistosoma margrebowiei]